MDQDSRLSKSVWGEFGKTAKERGLTLEKPMPRMLIETDDRNRYFVTTTGVVDLSTGIHQTQVPEMAYNIGCLTAIYGVQIKLDI